MWRRYRRPITLALPVGAALGCLMSLGVYLAGNPDYRRYGGWGAFVNTIVVGGAIGAVTALAAVGGGVLALLVWDRALVKSPPSRRDAAALGAALGTAVLWLAFGVVNGLLSPSGWSWFGLTGIVVAVAAPIAAIAAGMLVARAERRAADQPTIGRSTGSA
ncbi:MAG: hypothetical protein ACK5IN_08075 [Microbacterium sp.]|uniref:hypothetical protein n=1 Tax=Microbacterium sp. TaxID=51671 RepID=UPI003A8688E6